MAQEMWSYLRIIYHQEHKERRLQLAYEIAEYKKGDKSIQEHYSGFMD